MKGLLDHKFENGGVMVTRLEDLLNWARLSSMFPMTFGIACCAIEFMSTHQRIRYGPLWNGSPRHAPSG
jgi:NADH:ubiquinone oxidoreductase subunit B-like Fe-S oxidoreductase